MRVDELDRRLDAVLADGRLSRAELKALRRELTASAPDAHRRAELRARVFDRARQAMNDLGAEATLEWVEDVVRVLSPIEDGPAEVEAYFSPGEECLSGIIREFETAKKRVDVCVFTITDDRISRTIVAAHERGVDVRIISDDDKAHDLGSDVDRLGHSGIALRFDDTPAHMHHKFAIFDRDRLLTGSYNWTRSAARENHENLLVTNDGRLVARYQEQFDRLWNQLGRRR